MVGGATRVLICIFFTTDGDISLSASFSFEEQQNVQIIASSHYFIIKCNDSILNSFFKNTSPFLMTKTFQSVLGEIHSKKTKIRRPDDLSDEV